MNMDFLTKSPIRVYKAEWSKIVFSKNGTYSYFPEFRRRYTEKGSFTITGNTVTLLPEACRSDQVVIAEQYGLGSASS